MRMFEYQGLTKTEKELFFAHKSTTIFLPEFRAKNMKPEKAPMRDYLSSFICEKNRKKN